MPMISYLFINSYLNFKKHLTLDEHTSTVNCLIELNDRKIASGSSDKNIKKWDLSKNNSILTLNEHTDNVNCLIELKDGKIPSDSCDKNIKKCG